MRPYINFSSMLAYGILFEDGYELQKYIESIEWDENNDPYGIEECILEVENNCFSFLDLFDKLDPDNAKKQNHQLIAFGKSDNPSYILTPFWRRKNKKKYKNFCVISCNDEFIKVQKDLNVPEKVIRKFKKVLELHNLSTTKKLNWYLCNDIEF